MKVRGLCPVMGPSRLLGERQRAPLLLVHGMTADHTLWAPLLPHLEFFDAGVLEPDIFTERLVAFLWGKR